MRFKLKTKNLWYRGKLTCKICGRSFEHLGSHIWHKHKISARDYKSEFGLPFRESLISEKIYRKKAAAWQKCSKKYLKNLTKAGTKYQFPVGNPMAKLRRISEAERLRCIRRIKAVNEKRGGRLSVCPVCKMRFSHLASHLYNAHRLIDVSCLNPKKVVR